MNSAMLIYIAVIWVYGQLSLEQLFLVICDERHRSSSYCGCNSHGSPHSRILMTTNKTVWVTKITQHWINKSGDIPPSPGDIPGTFLKPISIGGSTVVTNHAEIIRTLKFIKLWMQMMAVLSFPFAETQEPRQLMRVLNPKQLYCPRTSCFSRNLC